jgi:hypothetical protein
MSHSKRRMALFSHLGLHIPIYGILLQRELASVARQRLTWWRGDLSSRKMNARAISIKTSTRIAYRVKNGLEHPYVRSLMDPHNIRESREIELMGADTSFLQINGTSWPTDICFETKEHCGCWVWSNLLDLVLILRSFMNTISSRSLQNYRSNGP